MPLAIGGIINILNPVIRQVIAPNAAAFNQWPPSAALGARALETVMENNAAKVRLLSNDKSCPLKTGRVAAMPSPEPPD